MVFMPPEALCQNPHYNEKVDIFSFGVLMLEIATQQEPQPGMEGIGIVPERVHVITYTEQLIHQEDLVMI